MTDDEFKRAMIEAIHAAPIGNTRELLIQYRDSGGSQETAYKFCREILTEIRESGVPEEVDDALLDTMDCVVGWCSSHSKVWPEYLKT